MFKKSRTRLLVENWRKFINESDQDITRSVKICQALMTKEGVKNFTKTFSTDDVSSFDTFKSTQKIFQVSKSIANALIIGPFSIKDNKTENIQSDVYYMMLFRDDQGSSDEYEYPQKLANWIQHNGSIGEINIKDINQLNSYAKQKNIDTKRVIKTKSNNNLYNFCKNATEGSAEKINGVEVLKPINGQIKSASAYSANNKELSNASVYK